MESTFCNWLEGKSEGDIVAYIIKKRPDLYTCSDGSYFPDSNSRWIRRIDGYQLVTDPKTIRKIACSILLYESGT